MASDEGGCKDTGQDFRTVHENTLGEIWYGCSECPGYKTKFGAVIRDHINSKHLKASLKCTHCSFTSFRAKLLNTHRSKHHQIPAMICTAKIRGKRECMYRTIVAEKLEEHLEKKHKYSPSDAEATTKNIIAAQKPEGKAQKVKAPKVKAYPVLLYSVLD